MRRAPAHRPRRERRRAPPRRRRSSSASSSGARSSVRTASPSASTTPGEVQAEEAGPARDRDPHQCGRRSRARVAACGLDRGGGAELTRTAAASRTSDRDRALADAGSAAVRAGVSPRSSRGRTRKWWAAPQQSATPDDRQLDEQRLPVARRPEIGHGRQPHDREIRAGEHEHGRRARSRAARSRGTPRGAAPVPAATRTRRAPRARRPRATPRPGGDSRRAPVSHVEFGSTAWCPDSESPVANPSAITKRRPEQPRAVEQPGEEQQRRDQREAEGHRDERHAEARLRRERREVAVHQVDERELERVLGAQDERGDADVDGRECRRPAARGRAGFDRRAGTGSRSTSSRSPSAAEQTRRARRSAPSARRRPPSVGPDAPYAWVGGGGATPMPNVKTPEPCGRPTTVTRHRTRVRPRASGLDTRRDHDPAAGSDVDASPRRSARLTRTPRGVGRDRDRLVEAQTDSARRRLDARLVAGVACLRRRVSERSPGSESSDEQRERERARLTSRVRRRAATDGRRSARRRDRRRAAPRPRSTSSRTPRSRRTGADAPSAPIGIDRRDQQRPAERVVKEGRAREEPRVLLVQQECEPADRRSRRETVERPPAARAACRARARAARRRRSSRSPPTTRARPCAASSW